MEPLLIRWIEFDPNSQIGSGTEIAAASSG